MSMSASDIPYLEFNWPLFQGCNGPLNQASVQERCAYCYLESLAKRYGRSMAPVFHAEHLDDPIRRRKPAIIGLTFGGDFCDPAFTVEQIVAARDVMARAHWHTFVCLTKQAERLRQLTEVHHLRWPGNAWMGVTVDRAGRAYRAADLQHVDCQHRWISAEPLCDSFWLPSAGGCRALPGFDAVVVGGQSGPGAPPLNLEAVRHLRDQCRAMGTAFVFKQGGGTFPEKWPELDGERHATVPWMREVPRG